MKRFLAAALAALLLAGCGAEDPAEEQPTLKEEMSLQTVLELAIEDQPLASPTPLTKEMLGDLFDLDDKEVAEFAGQITLSMVSADQLVLIKAKPEKLDAVVKALEARVELVRQTFRDYIPAEAAKADEGKVFTRGDYAFLVMVGDSQAESPDYGADVSRTEELILGCFE